MCTVMTTTFPIPLAPETRDELFQRHGIIAVLLPSGSAAAEGFSDLVDQILLAPHKHKHILDRQCIFLYRKEKRPLDEILDVGSNLFLPDQDRRPENDAHHNVDQDDLANASDTTCTSTTTVEPVLLWHGFVGISLEHGSEVPRFGWSVGYQPIWLDFVKSPDIPLCSEERGRLAKLHRRHVTFNFIHGTGTLALKALHERPRPRCDTNVFHTRYVRTF